MRLSITITPITTLMILHLILVLSMSMFMSMSMPMALAFQQPPPSSSSSSSSSSSCCYSSLQRRRRRQQQHTRANTFRLFAQQADEDESSNSNSNSSSSSSSSSSNNGIITTTTTSNNNKRSNIPPPRSSSNSNNNNNNNNDPAFLSQDSNGFTVKQRLREEVESPFRKVRLVFFGSSAGSALTALYFSFLSTIKAYQGGYADAPPLDEALTNDAINIGAFIVCALLAVREYQSGEKNLQRIAAGGRLAALNIELVDTTTRTAATNDMNNGNGSGNDSSRRMMIRKRLGDYRRFSRVVIAAGGADYISRLCASLTTTDDDQLQDTNTNTKTNTIPQRLEDNDMLVVPVLLSTISSVGDTKELWMSSSSSSVSSSKDDRSSSAVAAAAATADNILAYPLDKRAWETYLKSEIETATSQGFDVLEKGFTIIVKKNGRIMKRSTGLPPWLDLINTMEIADGSQFGMPGDTERYGGR